MNTEEKDDLWQLLGKARPPAVSPFFSRNVLRQVRLSRQEQPGLWSWLRLHWQLPTVATGLAAVALAAGTYFHPVRPEDGQIAAMAESVYASPDYHVIGHLDELLDSDKNSIWLGADAQ